MVAQVKDHKLEGLNQRIYNTMQKAHYFYGSRLVRAQSLDTGLENTGNSRDLSRKRLGMEIGSVGRNIRQKLPCYCLDNEGTGRLMQAYTILPEGIEQPSQDISQLQGNISSSLK